MEPEITQETTATATATLAIQPPQPRNFAIPGCEVVICCTQEGGMPVEQLLSIVFGLSNSNPGAKVDFWVKVIRES